MGLQWSVDHYIPVGASRAVSVNNNLSTHLYHEVQASVSSHHFGYSVATVAFGYRAEVEFGAGMLLHDCVRRGQETFIDAH